jgi:hypothetical protein
VVRLPHQNPDNRKEQHMERDPIPIPIELQSHAALQILNALDTEPRELRLSPMDIDTNTEKMILNVYCVINGDHEKTAHNVILKADGTWTLISEIEVY